jgi:arsenate reductase
LKSRERLRSDHAATGRTEPMKVSELSRLAGVAPSAVRWYEAVGVLPPATRGANGYREYAERDLARLRLVVALRRLGVAPAEAGRLAQVCLDRGTLDAGLVPVLAAQQAAIARQRADLDRLEGELLDLEMTIAAAGRATRREASVTPIRVLFVCTHNSARSQIAEALLGQHGGAAFDVHSAGTEATSVNPFAVRVLAELGIDWTGARSKLIAEFLDRRFDYVITVCDRARETCPVFPGSTNTLHWGLDDPSVTPGTDEVKLAAFRRTALELTARLRPFIEIALQASGQARRVSGGA